MEEFGDADLKSLADLVDDPKFDRVIGTLDEVAYGRFGNTAPGRKLVLGHVVLCQQLGNALADGFIHLHRITTFFYYIIGGS